MVLVDGRDQVGKLRYGGKDHPRQKAWSMIDCSVKLVIKSIQEDNVNTWRTVRFFKVMTTPASYFLCRHIHILIPGLVNYSHRTKIIWSPQKKIYTFYITITKLDHIPQAFTIDAKLGQILIIISPHITDPTYS